MDNCYGKTPRIARYFTQEHDGECRPRDAASTTQRHLRLFEPNIAPHGRMLQARYDSFNLSWATLIKSETVTFTT